MIMSSTFFPLLLLMIWKLWYVLSFYAAVDASNGLLTPDYPRRGHDSARSSRRNTPDSLQVGELISSSVIQLTVWVFFSSVFRVDYWEWLKWSFFWLQGYSNPLGSVASLNPDTIKQKNDERLRKLKSLAGRSVPPESSRSRSHFLV